MRSIEVIHLTYASPYTSTDLGSLIDDAMVAGIRVPDLIDLILMGIANGNVLELWLAWLGEQISNPDVSTTSYCTYNGLNPSDVYIELYESLYRHFSQQGVMLFKSCAVVQVEVIYLEEHTLHVRYFVRYRNP